MAFGLEGWERGWGGARAEGPRQECGKGWLRPDPSQCKVSTAVGGMVCVFTGTSGAGLEQRLHEVQGWGMAE